MHVALFHILRLGWVWVVNWDGPHYLSDVIILPRGSQNVRIWKHLSPMSSRNLTRGTPYTTFPIKRIGLLLHWYRDILPVYQY